MLTSTPTDERLRQKLLRLIDGHSPCLHYAHQVFNLKHCERVTDWLLQRGLTGKSLDEWVLEKHQGSILKAISFIVADVNKTVARPVRMGVEYGRQ